MPIFPILKKNGRQNQIISVKNRSKQPEIGQSISTPDKNSHFIIPKISMFMLSWRYGNKT
jgi:hypothetical protein